MKVIHLPHTSTLIDLLLVVSYLRTAICEAERCITHFSQSAYLDRELLPCHNFIIVTFATLFDVV